MVVCFYLISMHKYNLPYFQTCVYILRKVIFMHTKKICIEYHLVEKNKKNYFLVYCQKIDKPEKIFFQIDRLNDFNSKISKFFGQLIVAINKSENNQHTHTKNLKLNRELIFQNGGCVHMKKNIILHITKKKFFIFFCCVVYARRACIHECVHNFLMNNK